MSEAIELVDKMIHELEFMTPDQMAERFKALGIQGIPMAAKSCPVTKYLKQQTGARTVASTQVSISASTEELTGEQSRNYASYEYRNNEVPNSVARFMSRFDSGKYPNLIEPGAVPYEPSGSFLI